MHQLTVTLVNPDGFRLVWYVSFKERNTPNEHLGCTVAAEEANHSEYHRKHGPWTAARSLWTS